MPGRLLAFSAAILHERARMQTIINPFQEMTMEYIYIYINMQIVCVVCASTPKYFSRICSTRLHKFLPASCWPCPSTESILFQNNLSSGRHWSHYVAYLLHIVYMTITDHMRKDCQRSTHNIPDKHPQYIIISAISCLVGLEDSRPHSLDLNHKQHLVRKCKMEMCGKGLGVC